MASEYPLEHVPLFRNVPSSQLEPLRSSAVRQVFASGAAIFRQADIPSGGR